LGKVCDDGQTCDFKVDHTQIGDPFPGCQKDFEVAYGCGLGAVLRQASLKPEASGQALRLSLRLIPMRLCRVCVVVGALTCLPRGGPAGAVGAQTAAAVRRDGLDDVGAASVVASVAAALALTEMAI
jgi:hypothetical protein